MNNIQILSTDDISKMPRLPGDGAQTESESNFDESSHTPATMSCRPSAQTLKESFLECQEGKWPYIV